MLSRQDVYSLIDQERDYQNLISKSDDHALGVWLEIIDEYLFGATDLSDRGFPAEAEEKLLQAVAVGVAALEQHGVTGRTVMLT